MRLKNGFQQCPRCQGKGCWRCRQKGYIVQCPRCGLAENEFMAKNEDDNYHCGGCATVFSKAGDIITVSEPPAKKKKLPRAT